MHPSLAKECQLDIFLKLSSTGSETVSFKVSFQMRVLKILDFGRCTWGLIFPANAVFVLMKRNQGKSSCRNFFSLKISLLKELGVLTFVIRTKTYC